MARKTKTVDGKTGTRKKKKTTRKKTTRRKATLKTAVETIEAGDDHLEIEAPSATADVPPGIVCPRCGCRDLRAPDGRPWEITKVERKYGFIRRRRVCRHCGKVVNTHERIEN